MLILGFDPGLTGAMGVINTAGEFVAVVDIPTMASGGKSAKVQRMVDPVSLRLAITGACYRANTTVWMAAIERVSAMPGQGVSGVFSLGDTFGAIRATVAGKGIPCEFPPPGLWKRALGLDSDKERCRAKAIQLFPAAAEFLSRKKDHNRSEALLLAEWLRRAHS